MSIATTMKKNAITFIVSGLAPMSTKAFKAFNLTRIAYYQGRDFLVDWHYDAIFSVALYEHFLKVSPADAKRVKDIILSADWIFDGSNIYTSYRKYNDPNPTVIVRQYGNSEELTPKEYHGRETCFEVLRDICLPAVYNW